MHPHLPEDYMFPECYVGEESETRLVMELKLAALLEGFSLVVGSKEYVPPNKATSNRLVAIRPSGEGGLPGLDGSGRGRRRPGGSSRTQEWCQMPGRRAKQLLVLRRAFRGLSR